MNNKLYVQIPAQAAHSYPLIIESGLLQRWREWLPQYTPARKVIIISDNYVSATYGRNLVLELQAEGFQVKMLEFVAGEASKTAATKLQLEEQMFAWGCDRHTLCLALGGGVVGDLAGFTAATYMRGINFIQVPTSLLAMIDSSVGGKTAVNTSYGKNIIGAFWQPKAVFMDTATLKTLPKQHILNGLFEAIKIFLTFDKSMLEFASKHLEQILSLQDEYVVKVIYEAVKLKAYVVEVDEKEQNLRMILNFGHSVGHALEKLSNYNLLHGFAVGVGMLVEAKIANLRGLLSDNDFRRVEQILAALGATRSQLLEFAPEQIITVMRGDKKNFNLQIKLVLLTAIGQVKNENNQVAFAVTEQEIVEALAALSKEV